MIAIVEGMAEAFEKSPFITTYMVVLCVLIGAASVVMAIAMWQLRKEAEERLKEYLQRTTRTPSKRKREINAATLCVACSHPIYAYTYGITLRSSNTRQAESSCYIWKQPTTK